MPSEITENNHQGVSRRVFLQWVLALTATAATGCLPNHTKTPEPPKDPEKPLKPETLELTNELFILGAAKETSLAAFGIEYTPDGHITYIQSPNNRRRYFISGNSSSYMIESDLNYTLAQAAVVSENKPVKVYGPDRTLPYRNGYGTITSVIQPDNNNRLRLLAFAHNEEQREREEGTLDENNFTASIGFLTSDDGGLHWQDKGPILRGSDWLPPGKRISGAGQPCAVVKDGYIYLYYIDWASQQKVQHSDQIYLARAKLNNAGIPDQFEHYTNTGFKLECDPNELKPVIPVPTDIPNSIYTALPSVSFNKELNRLCCVFETNVGFCATTSENGVNWAPPRLIARFPIPHSNLQVGDTWFSYPSLLSDNLENSDQVTNSNGILYCSKGKWQEKPHQLIAMSFNLA